MEYIQTILLQVEASQLERASEAGGLLSEIDQHREFLREQPGFHDMRVTRSINNEGNVLVVVETRWSDDTSLVHYETNEPNLATIVRRYDDVIVPGSLQVLDMEALRSESFWGPLETARAARARVTLPLLIPVGALAFALLVIYGLSRIYLSLEGNTAPVALAAGISIGVLLIATYMVMNPRVPGWQVGGVFVALVALLIGGTTWALIEGESGEAKVEQPPAGSPSPSASPGGGGGGALAVSMGDNFFEYEGQKEPAIPVSAGATVSFDITNDGTAIHNMRVAGEDNQYNNGDDAVSDPDLVTGGQTATLEWAAPAQTGTYDFRCDFHPDQMKGTTVVE